MISTTCWSLPSGGYIETNVSSTPPVAGAKPSICPNKANMPIQVTQSQSNKQSLEPTVKTTTIQNTNFVHPLENKKTAIHPEGAFYDPAYNNGIKKENWAEHLGTDLLAPGGSIVFAMKPGKVEICNPQAKHPWSKAILITNDETTIIYGHVNYLETDRDGKTTKVFVKNGDRVMAGDKIGIVMHRVPGFGDHLHLGEIKKVIEEDKDNVVTCNSLAQNGWGFGRAPYGTDISVPINKGWINMADFYGFKKQIEIDY